MLLTSSFLESTVEASKRELEVDWDQFYPLLEEILKRVPQLKDTYLESLINTPIAFSPDAKWILGEAPEVNSFHKSCISCQSSESIKFS